MMKFLALLSLLLTAPLLQAAEVNKCEDAAGNITLTDMPCATVKPKPVSAFKPKPEPMSQPQAGPVLPAPEKRYAPPPPPPPPMAPLGAAAR